jgi:hypothetical protein
MFLEKETFDFHSVMLLDSKGLYITSNDVEQISYLNNDLLVIDLFNGTTIYYNGKFAIEGKEK